MYGLADLVYYRYAVVSMYMLSDLLDMKTFFFFIDNYAELDDLDNPYLLYSQWSLAFSCTDVSLDSKAFCLTLISVLHYTSLSQVFFERPLQINVWLAAKI